MFQTVTFHGFTGASRFFGESSPWRLDISRELRRNDHISIEIREIARPNDFSKTRMILILPDYFCRAMVCFSLSLSLPFSVVKMGLIEERSGEFTIFAPLFLLFFFDGFRENFYFAAIFTSLYLDVWLSASLDEFEKWSRKRGWIIKRR